MMRPALILVLLLTTALMMRGVASDWRKVQALPEQVAAKKTTPAPPETLAPMPQLKDLQPVVPGVLPDLKDGYLFNPARTLVEEKPQPVVEEPVAPEIQPSGVDASIDEVTYVGSIITDAFSQAIISYPGGPKVKAPPKQLRSPRSSRVKAPQKSSGPEEHARLEIGDTLDGYEVAEILPDKLIFSKGEEKVEKLLHDPDKKREAPPRNAGALSGPPRMQQGGGAPPRPGGILSTTIGGGPVSTPVQAPGTVVTPSPSAAPPLPTGVRTPPGGSTPSSPSQGASAPQMPVKRMVISRQPAPAPNTNKVIRQSQDTTVEMPPSPGMSPSSITTPPMPGGN